MSGPIAEMTLQPLLSSTTPATITVVQVLPKLWPPSLFLQFTFGGAQIGSGPLEGAFGFGERDFGFWWE